MKMEPIKKSRNKLVGISYVISIATYLIGLYFLIQGHLLAFLGTIPTLILGVYLLYKNERRYGIVLVIFFFVWIIIYYSYLPKTLSL